MRVSETEIVCAFVCMCVFCAYVCVWRRFIPPSNPHAINYVSIDTLISEDEICHQDSVRNVVLVVDEDVVLVVAKATNKISLYM